MPRCPWRAAQIGRTKLEVKAVEAFPETGVELLRLGLPEGHGLKGRQFLQILTPGQSSNRVPVVLP